MTRQSRLGLSFGFFCLLLVLASWGAQGWDSVVALAPFGFSLTSAIALYYSLSCRHTLLLVFVVQIGLAYALGATQAVSAGMRFHGLQVLPSSVAAGLGITSLFVAITAATALALRSRRRALISRGSRHADHRRMQLCTLLLAATLCAAVINDSWTFYLGGDPDGGRSSGLRLDLLYPPLLAAVLMVTWHRLVVSGGTPRRSLRLWLFLLVLLGLEFVLQMRRLMLTTFAFGVLSTLETDEFRARLRSLRGILAVGLTGSLLVLGVFAGSTLWRAAALEAGSDRSGMAGRVSTMVGLAHSGVESNFTERFIYLSATAASIEYCDELRGQVSLLRAAASTFVGALPGALFPWKYDASGSVVTVSCESAFANLGVRTDLPCTPEGEAYLSGGPAAVVLLAVIWGGFLAFLARLYNSGTHTSRLLALVAFMPLSIVETSAFPMVHSLRNLAIVAACLYVGERVFRLLPWRARRRAGSHEHFFPDRTGER